MTTEHESFEIVTDPQVEERQKQAVALADTVVSSKWGALPDHFLTDRPSARRWLLRHPTRDGNACAPSGGDGLLPLGKVGVISSEGGTGKTNLLLALAAGIPLGQRWLGHFDVDHNAQSGRVLLALAEEDADEVHRRLFNLAQSWELSLPDRLRIVQQVVILPLSGSPVALMGYDKASNVVTGRELDALRLKLHDEGGDHGWSLVALDPLARWAGPDVEGDTGTATRFVQALESLTDVPGRPTVLVAHHSSKMARRTGDVDSRGVTAITDGMRWAATLRTDKDRVLFRQTKSNYSVPMLEELVLTRGTGGLLRVPNEAELAGRRAYEAERETAAAVERQKRRNIKVEVISEQLIVALLRARHPPRTRVDLVALVTGETAIVQEAISRLLMSGRLRGGRGEAYSVTPEVGPS